MEFLETRWGGGGDQLDPANRLRISRIFELVGWAAPPAPPPPLPRATFPFDFVFRKAKLGNSQRNRSIFKANGVVCLEQLVRHTQPGSAGQMWTIAIPSCIEYVGL